MSAMKANAAQMDFDLPVDSDNKATAIKIYSAARPHMRAFHCTWSGFFISFFSTFAAAPLMAYIRDDLNLQKGDIVMSGIAAVTGTIFARIVMGTVCDIVGPRFGFAILLLGTSPAVFCMSLVQSAAGLIAMRSMIGFSLATFVACQFWTSVMFSSNVVGLANATTAGWGNLGGGVTQLLMPQIFNGMLNACGFTYEAWRWAYFFPGFAHIIIGLVTLLGAQDMPEGNYAAMKKAGLLENKSVGNVMMLGVSNYRMWILVATYGLCFGVELTMNNVAAPYFLDQFEELNVATAGAIASIFGFMNIFARSLGGLTSDMFCRKYGMRGRLWTLWLCQTLQGCVCMLMGALHNTLAGTIIAMIVFSMLVQASEGASYAVVPFVSRRALGVCSGFIGAGGNAGSAITQALFFKPSSIETYEGITFTGLMTVCVTALIMFIHFPMWGGMFFGPTEGATEETYYVKGEFSEEEEKQGLANGVKRFIENASRTERPPAMRPDSAVGDKPSFTPDKAAAENSA